MLPLAASSAACWRRIAKDFRWDGYGWWHRIVKLLERVLRALMRRISDVTFIYGVEVIDLRAGSNSAQAFNAVKDALDLLHAAAPDAFSQVVRNVPLIVVGPKPSHPSSVDILNEPRHQIQSPTATATPLGSRTLVGAPLVKALVGILAILVASAAQAQTAPLYRDAGAPIDARVQDLLGRMTLEEKFWQLFMIPGSLDDSTHDYRHGVFGLQVRMPEGTTAREHAEELNRIQRWFVERTRLGIPMLAFEEAIHGLLAHDATVFPVSIGLAATFDTALVARVAYAIAREARSRGIRDVLSPVVNIATDPPWGRTEETYGEVPGTGATTESCSSTIRSGRSPTCAAPPPAARRSAASSGAAPTRTPS